MDMDVRRDRHPWFVPASEWPVEFEDVNGGFTTSAGARVDRNGSAQPGVRPGGLNRTSVANFVPDQQSDAILVPVKQRGPNFGFAAEKHGGDKSYDSTKL